MLSVGELLPRRGALAAGNVLGRLGYFLGQRQRNVAHRNLEMALPELSRSERTAIVHGVFANLGRLLAEFSQFPRLTAERIRAIVEYDGLEHYTDAQALGKGVLFLTAHIGSWELSSFAHALYGHPMHFLTRPIDNPLVEALITSFRTRSGNSVIRRTEAAREVLRALGGKATVGILIDQNTTRSEGVFVDFFGIPAATTTGLAALALRTGAPVVPGFIRWDPERRKHILEFQRPIGVVRTGDRRKDLIENTQRFNQVIEDFVRRYPDQWLWIHKRWNTRPEGDESLYANLGETR